MNPNVRDAVLIVATIFCFAFIAMTVAATGAFFWPPQTFGQLLGDVFTVAGVVFALMILLAVLSAIRNPPPGE